MFNPFSRSPITAQDWQERARLFQEQINGLSIDELMRGVGTDGAKLGEPSGRGGHHYDPNQPRVPAGHSDGGQWTSTGGNAPETGIPDVLSDAVPENHWRPGAQYASRIRGRGGGLLSQATPAQLFRLSAAQAQARDAIRRIREIEPNWRPRPSAYETVEGMIRAHQADAQQAEARIAEFNQGYLVGPGRFATESVPAPAFGQRLTAEGRRRLNEIGSVSGCHTCGTLNPRTTTGNWIGDHQWPTALNRPGRAQRLFPQCKTCSAYQGGKLRALTRRRSQ